MNMNLHMRMGQWQMPLRVIQSFSHFKEETDKLELLSGSTLYLEN